MAKTPKQFMEKAAPAPADKKQAALEAALNDLQKRYGQGSVGRMKDFGNLKVEAISTGSLALDLAIGIGGMPRGRIVEIYGPESSGKSTICQHVVAEAQKMGENALYIDLENAIDPAYAARIGVDMDNLILAQPQSAEEALEIAETLIRSGAVAVVVIDSVAALVPKSEIEGDMGDSTMGVHARLMSQALRKLQGPAKETNTLVLFTNQLRQKIGVMFGNPETTPGGMALKFWASVRLDIRSKEVDKEAGTRVSEVKVVKNKVHPPFKTARIAIGLNGIDPRAEILDLAVAHELVKKSGGHHWLADETKIGASRDQALNYLSDHPEVMVSLRSQILAKATSQHDDFVPEEDEAIPPELE